MISRSAQRLFATFLLAAALLSPASKAAQTAKPPIPTEIELFVSTGCRHCAEARAFLDALAKERSGLRIIVRDVRNDPATLARLAELSRVSGATRPGVPTMRIGKRLIVGFDSATTSGARIRNALDTLQAQEQAVADSTCGIEVEASCEAVAEDSIDIPFTGKQISVESFGLPLFTVLVGLLDGLNPCSMWVLILMLSMLAGLRDRRKMLAVAGTFVAIQGLAYFAFMAAWLNLFLLAGLSRASMLAIGALALIAGAINLKDYFAQGRGISLSIPDSAKPAIYRRLRAIITADSLWPALAGTAILAFLVQVVELMCTSGFPALYTRILTMRHPDQAGYYGYLALYNAMYMLDDIIVLGIGVFTLSQRRLQEKEGRRLKLLAGLVMLGLGIYLIALR